MKNVTEFLIGAQNITTQSELLQYAATELFIPAVIAIFVAVLLLMLIMGAVIIRKDKANFYAIFVFNWLIIAILLFFVFWFPIIPQFLSKFSGSIF